MSISGANQSKRKVRFDIDDISTLENAQTPSNNNNHRQNKYRGKKREKKKASFPYCFCFLLIAFCGAFFWQIRGSNSIHKKITATSNGSNSSIGFQAGSKLFGNLSREQAVSAPIEQSLENDKQGTKSFGGLSRKQAVSAPIKHPLENDKQGNEVFLADVSKEQDLDQNMIPQVNRQEQGGRKRAAFAVTVTQDGSGHYADGAAVLAHGIRTACRNSEYNIDLVAIVDKNATQSQAWLAKLGYRVIVRTIPVQVDEIRGTFLRNRIVGSGCCGETELLKLYIYDLEEYERVLALDMDSMVMQCPDDLFGRKELGMYTYDYGMMGKKENAKPAVQGGFILIKPDKKVLQEYIEIYREGDFRTKGAWGGSGIGWFWGGVTIQGVISYYYNALHKGEGAEIDRCIYNNMADNPTCRETPLDQIKNVHFTVCQKPWGCHSRFKSDHCAAFHKKWLSLRAEFERSLGQEVSNACPRSGKKNYQLMNLTQLGLAFEGKS